MKPSLFHRSRVFAVRSLLLLGLCLAIVLAGCSKHVASEELSTAVDTGNPKELTGKSTGLSTGEKNMKIRPSVLAGRWYPSNRDELSKSINSFMDKAPKHELNGHLWGIVAPHAGHVWSGGVAAASYKAVDISRVNRVFILCPNHRMPVMGIVGVSVDAFETPLGNVKIDTNLVSKWRDEHVVDIDDSAHKLEHAIEIQLPFLQTIFKDEDYTIVPLIVGEISSREAKAFARNLRAELREDDLVLVSSDFLHYGENYGFVPFGAPVLENIRAYDQKTVDAFSKMDGESFESFARANRHCACGVNSLRVVSFAFAGLNVKELSYDTSGHLSDDDSMSVSYEALAIYGDLKPLEEKETMETQSTNAPLSPEAQKVAHGIVKRALQEAVSEQRETPKPKDLSSLDIFQEWFGVFVTLNEKSGRLRGCIGNIIPVGTLEDGLWGRAQDAALNDPRFDPVQEDELPNLDIEISVLTKPKPISGPKEIVIGKHGVVMHKMGRSAVFLPQVAPEQGWDVEEMLVHLSMKAGLRPHDWQEGATFQVFEAQVF